MRRLVAIIFWSAISAAFIGPGTVATAARAGASFRFELLWALAFSTIACLVLQESSARLTILSGKTLGAALKNRFASGRALRAIPFVAVGAVVLGCAAYEAGNVLGAREGLALLLPARLIEPIAITIACGVFLAGALLAGSPRIVALGLGVLVALMGGAFLLCAIFLRPDIASVLGGTIKPSFPAGSATLILGLIGTTVVPYNLFLGSALATRRDLAETRFALRIAIPLGGVISMAVVVVGTAVTGDLTYAAVSHALETSLGGGSGRLFALGLFGAGISSALTAPFAAGLAVASLYNDERRETRIRRGVALAVLGFGLAVALIGLQPIPVIILAQAANGVLLPFVAIFLLVAVNDRALVGDEGRPGALANGVIGISVVVTLLLGAYALFRAASTAFGS